ncbi:MAG: tetratricopeptide repeat protein, partial [Labilithrix sp.]|nr:tetratricopeptide repeat protein [Labilithrix sp.]
MNAGLWGRKATFATIMVLGLLAAPPEAAAQPKPDKAAQDAHAKELFAKGDAAYAEGRYEEALAAFQEAYTLSGRPQLLFNVSNALERLGRYAEATDALEKYLASGKARDRDVVQKRLANLKKRVEEQKKEQEQKAKEEEEKRGEEREKRKGEEGQPAAVQPVVVVPPPEKSTSVLPIVLVGAGGALIATGVVFGILTLSARSDASAGCADGAAGNLCNGDARSALDREKTFGLVTDITLASGIVATGVGIYLLLT